jgi:hypothetical protein
LLATLRPARYTRAKSSERVSRPRGRSTLLRRQTLAALEAPALQNRPPRACAHAHQEAVGLLALSLVRLIRPFHVPSLARCLRLRPSTIRASPHLVRQVRNHPPPGALPPTRDHPGERRSISSLLRTRQSRHIRPLAPPPHPPAASVHTPLWTLWTTTSCPLPVAPSSSIPVHRVGVATAAGAPPPAAVTSLRPLVARDYRILRPACPASCLRLPHPASRKPAIHLLFLTPSAWRETTIPIFNRKAGLCGRSLPRFRTFSPPVDSPVDKLMSRPANSPSSSTEHSPPKPRAQPKPLLFAHPLSPHCCGKTMYA